MRILNRAISRISGPWKEMRYNKTTAKNPRHSDVYIVEFPKSGITWLSSLLANMALTASGRKEVASFTAAHLYVPDIHITRDIGSAAYDTPPVRFIKSHSEFNPNYIYVIYLVRNPLDTMKSYYRFNREHGKEVGDFDAFCRSDRLGVPAWKRHINSWLTGGVIATRLHLSRYEDLLRETASEIELINKNFGWGIETTAIELAVSRSSVDVMRGNEEIYRSRNPRYSITFVRGNNDFEIDEKTVFYINRECSNELKLIGYVE